MDSLRCRGMSWPEGLLLFFSGLVLMHLAEGRLSVEINRGQEAVAWLMASSAVRRAHGVSPEAIRVADSLLAKVRQDGARVDYETIAKITHAVLLLRERERSLPVNLLGAVISTETGGTWRTDLVSPKGAVGLMQVMPKTGRWIGERYGLAVTDSLLTDPTINVLVGGLYLWELVQAHGLRQGVAAYNAGPGRLARAEVFPDGLPSETQRYIGRVLSCLGMED